jgi:hypothetical protein
MTKKELIDMAKQSGARPSSNPDEYDVLKITYRSLEAFAKLVAEKAIKEALAQPEQEPVGYVSEGEPDRLIAQKQTKTPLRNYRLFTHDVPLYTTPHTKVGCVECRVSGGHAFYCVACAKKLFGGYKESESFDRTASHMVNEYVEYKDPILTDAEISESYYEVFKTAMIDIKAFEFAYSLLRKAQEK